MSHVNGLKDYTELTTKHFKIVNEFACIWHRKTICLDRETDALSVVITIVVFIEIGAQLVMEYEQMESKKSNSLFEVVN